MKWNIPRGRRCRRHARLYNARRDGLPRVRDMQKHVPPLTAARQSAAFAEATASQGDSRSLVALAPRLTALVEEAVDGMPQPFPIDRFREMRREARRFGRRDITVRSETAEGNSSQLARIAQFAHQI